MAQVCQTCRLGVPHSPSHPTYSAFLSSLVSPLGNWRQQADDKLGFSFFVLPILLQRHCPQPRIQIRGRPFQLRERRRRLPCSCWSALAAASPRLRRADVNQEQEPAMAAAATKRARAADGGSICGSDRLSALPDDLRRRVLSFLPAQQAV